MMRFLEFLGAVTILFILVYGTLFFIKGGQGEGIETDSAQIRQEIVPAYQNLVLAEGQCEIIEMYSMSWCGYCRIKRQQFQEQNIAFKEYVLDHDRAAERAFKKMMRERKIRKYCYPTFIINDRYTRNYPVDYLVQQTCS